MLILLINYQTRKSRYPDLYPAVKAVSCIGRAPTLRSMQPHCQWTAHQSAPACRAPASSSRARSEMRRPSVRLAIGTEAPRSEGKDHPFESCRVRHCTPRHVGASSKGRFLRCGSGFAVLRRGGMWTRIAERIDTAARNRAIYSPCSPVRSASARSASPSCPDPAVSRCLLRR
jgi:hypothetical protein